MGLLSHRIDRSEIVKGDHIYTWRTAFTYSHHGIYVGGSTVVHFTGGRGESLLSFSSINSGSYFNISDFGSNVESSCPNFPDVCGFHQPNSGVVVSCLDCFVGTTGSLYRYEYGVTPTMFLVKLRGGSTTAESDLPDEVIYRALYLLKNGFGNYDVFRNNCEDFALYCKTGILIPGQTTLGRSGQAASVIGAPLSTALFSSPLQLFTSSRLSAAITSSPLKLLMSSRLSAAITSSPLKLLMSSRLSAAITSSPLKLFMSSPLPAVLQVTTTAVMYCRSRYVADIGVRTDVLKMSVEDLALYNGWNRD